MQSAIAIAKENGADIVDLASHAENLIFRFKNTALGDTVERVGKDTIRKLGNNDRMVGALLLAEKQNLPCEYLCIGIAAGMLFNPQADERSVELSKYANDYGVMATLEKYCGYNGKMSGTIEALYAKFKNGEKLTDVINYVEELAGKEIIV